jgi:hypothetical protein
MDIVVDAEGNAIQMFAEVIENIWGVLPRLCTVEGDVEGLI